MDNKEYYGVREEKTKETDWLGADLAFVRAPKGTNSFITNGSIQYNQNDVAPMSCTVTGAMGAYSALTGLKFSLANRKEIWQLALDRGASDTTGWFIDDAVDLVRQWVNDKFPVKVSSYRINIGSFEHGVATRLGYSVITGYRGNALFNVDRDDDGVIQGTEFINHTYGHCLHTNYSVGDEYDRIVDSYTKRATNLYLISTANWKKLVANQVFFRTGYIYIPQP